MSDESKNKDEVLEQAKAAAEQSESEEVAHAPKKKHKKGIIIAVVIIVVLVVGGIGFDKWHQQPSFCATMCHIEQTYVNNYQQPQNSVGTDKYGNTVSNTNAMMAVLHRETGTSAIPTMNCLSCHVPNTMELAHDGVNYFTGNYYLPRTERSVEMLERWDKKDGTQFCANENCHVYLLGSDGLLDRDKLEASSAWMDFNPHSQHHEGIQMSCTECHKGHRASVYQCTGCHDDITLPDGWVTKAEGDQILEDAYNK